MQTIEVTDDELELLELWREQQKDERRRRLQYGPSLDTPLRYGNEGERFTLGDTVRDEARVLPSTSLADTAERLGIELPWLSAKAQASRDRGRRTKIVADEVVCIEHGDEDMRPYGRNGKTYFRCQVCRRRHQARYNREYRRQMKDKVRPCPRCGTEGHFTGPYCKPCHATYERERRHRNG